MSDPHKIWEGSRWENYTAWGQLPKPIISLGQITSDVIQRIFGGPGVGWCEGLMIWVSLIVMAVSIGIWFAIDVGNRRDQAASAAMQHQRFNMSHSPDSNTKKSN